MPREYKRKTRNGQASHEVMLMAVKEVRENSRSIREVALEKGVSKSALHRYIGKYESHPDITLEPNYKHSLIFTREQESSLSEYLMKCSKMFHGLTPSQTRELAYEMAVRNDLDMPSSWKTARMAGKEWLAGFLKRNTSLSIRTPEATSLARMTGFNEVSLRDYFLNLEHLIGLTKVRGARIFNLDESGCTTVQRVPKVISQKGTKQVGQVTSRERGELITLCGIISAAGVALPPVLVFPRKRYRDIFLNGTPEGTVGLVSDSGWMNSVIFRKVMDHLVSSTGATVENPIILILDNHESHLSLDVIEYVINNGVHMLTLPPHTSHKTQSLDRAVFGPLKKYFNDEVNSWMMRHPGKTVTIYQMGQLIGNSWLKAASPHNIISGFSCTGIWPLDKHVFSHDDYLPSTIFDKENIPKQGTSEIPEDNPVEPELENPEPEPEIDEPRFEFVSPEMIRSYPKATVTKSTRRNSRKRRKSSIIATSPMEIKRMKEKVNISFSRDDEAVEILNLAEDLESQTSQEDGDEVVADNSADIVSYPPVVIGDVRKDLIVVNSFVLVEFTLKRSSLSVYYIGKVLSIEESDDVIVSFLRKSHKWENKFVYPIVEDKHLVATKDIHAILPAPVAIGTTARTMNSVVAFPVSLTNLNIR